MKNSFTQKNVTLVKIDLVHFTTRVPDTSDTTATRMTQVPDKQHEYDTSEKY